MESKKNKKDIIAWNREFNGLACEILISYLCKPSFILILTEVMVVSIQIVLKVRCKAKNIAIIELINSITGFN